MKYREVVELVDTAVKLPPDKPMRSGPGVAGSNPALPTIMPLFIPLKGVYFDLFKSGEKKTEYRPYGPRWNERTCPIGRKVVLSRGYGKAHRLYGVVTGFEMRRDIVRTRLWQEIYGRKYEHAACIQIAVARPCPAPIDGKTTAAECIEAGQCGCDEKSANSISENERGS